MDITLINPPEKRRVWAGIPQAMAYGVYCFPPLALMYLQSAIEKGTPHRCEILDPVVDNLDYLQFERVLRRYPLDLVGISAYTHSLPDVQSTIDLVRKYNPDARIILGGPHCIMFPDQAIALRGVDAICTGDGDEAFVEVVQRWEKGQDLRGVLGVWGRDEDGGVIRNPGRPQRKDMASMLWPDRSRSRVQDYWVPGTRHPRVATALTSYGCPHNCPFCFTHKQSYRVREIRDILDEMEHCVSLGVGEVFFIDDLFTPNAKWATKFSHAVRDRGLKFEWGYKTTVNGTTQAQIAANRDAGCTKIHFGVESTHDETLKLYRKHTDRTGVRQVFRWCKEEGVRSVAYIMIGGPEDRTVDDVRRNLDDLLELEPEYVVFAVYSPYPGTEAFEDGARKGLYPADCWDRLMADPLCGADVPVCWEEHLSRDQLLDLLKECHRRFYFRPSIIARNVINLRTPQELRRLAGGFMSLVKLELLDSASRGAPV
ncbi:B12-binding domain-containing radical SAM protein [Myxococcota bacterium]|nr:B12-binding domain-containing radical SAM protein [Myxococcota bacterium]